MDVAAECAVLFPISHPPIIAALLPYLAGETSLPLCPKGKSTFDELQRPFQTQSWRDQQMKMIGHQHKFMQQVLFLSPIAKQNLHKESCHPVGLKYVLFLKCGSRDEVRAVSGIASVWERP